MASPNAYSLHVFDEIRQKNNKCLGEHRERTNSHNTAYPTSMMLWDENVDSKIH